MKHVMMLSLCAASLAGCDKASRKGENGRSVDLFREGHPEQSADSTKESLAKLQAQIARLEQENARSNKLSEASSLRLAMELEFHVFPAFIGVISVTEHRAPEVQQVWFGRVPADFADYLKEPSPGLYLVGRLIGDPPSTATPPYSERFCHRIAPDGEVVGLDPDHPVNVRTLIEKLGARYKMNSPNE